MLFKIISISIIITTTAQAIFKIAINSSNKIAIKMSSIVNMSLYIPHVFANISKEFISETFETLRIGKVNKIDFVYKLGKDAPYNTAYVHFENWYDNTAAYNFQQRVLNPEKEARLIYDEPWYWIVLENKAKKHVMGDRKPRIALGLPDEIAAPFNEKQMTNQDFSDMVNVSAADMPPLTDEDQMDELLDLMEEEECEHLITIDGRYVEELEQEVHFGRSNVQYVCKLENENQELKNELAFLQGIVAQMSQRY